MRIGIIGAGATGLAAAYYLTQQGCEVIVYESAPFWGGHASTFDIGGSRLERGYHHWFTNDTDILQLVTEIGLQDSIRWIDSTVGTLYQNKIYNFVTPLDLLKFHPLKLTDRIRLGLTTLYLQHQKDWRKYENITANDWLKKYAGKGPYEVFWEPMLKGKFGQDYFDKVTMAWVWGKINTRVKSRSKSMVKEKLGYPMGSFGEIFDVLVDRIREKGGEINLSSLVDSISVTNGRLQGITATSKNSPARFSRFDAVIATTPSHIFQKIVPELPNNYTAKLSKAKYMAAVLIVLVLKRPLSPVYWLNVADRSIPFVGVIEHTNLIGPEHYGGKHIVYLSNYLSPEHSLYHMKHEELLETYLPHLRKVNPCFDLSWIETTYHHRVDGAQPIIGTNYSQHIPDHRTPFNGVYLANTTQIYPEDRGTNYSIRMGREVAGMVLQDARVT